MSMFTLQTLGLILLFGLIGLLVGWLIRSFFCKPSIGGGSVNLSGSSTGGTSTNAAVDTSYKKGNTGTGTSSASASVDTSGSSGTLNTAATTAGIAAVAATAAAVASSKKDDAVETVSGAIDSASDGISGSVDAVTDTISGAGDTIKESASGVVDSVSTTVTGAAESVSEAASDAVNGSIDTATDVAGPATDSVSSVAAGLTGAAAVAAAAYSSSASADATETNNADASTATEEAGLSTTAQTATGQADSPQQLRQDAESMLREDFAGAADGVSHIIIGAGPAGIVAAETIRKLDNKAIITIIADEPEAPYSRMAIPYFLEENIQAEGTHLRKAENHYEDLDIQILSGRVKSVDTENKQVETSNGLRLDYDKLLIATGSHPLTPPIPGLDNPKVGNCWDLADSRKIIENVKPGSTVVQIGAGFIGCIILEALVKRGAKLTVVEMDNRMVPRMLDEQCGGMLKSWCESKGVTVLTETQVQSIEDNGDRIKVNLSKGDAIDADYVISATGVASNTDFLKGSGIQLDQGVLVNQHLETNIPDVYAAGDVAQGIDFTTGGYSVHAIQPTAADHGTISAKNMVKGNQTNYKGSLQMNILSTLDLISTSYGAWEGVEGGEFTELVDSDKYRYIRLQFKDDQLVGANTLGITQNIGALRGLIQSRTKLGPWKAQLMENPLHFMDAYVALLGNHA